MIKKLILSLTFVSVVISGFWIYKFPDDLEAKITFVGCLIGILTLMAKILPRKEEKLAIQKRTPLSSNQDESKYVTISKAAPIKSSDIEPSEQLVEISPVVFVSYAHDSEDHKEMALELADKLNNLGIDCWIDRYVEDNPPSRGWPFWMEERIRLSSFILLVCSERYLARIEGSEIAATGRGVKFESMLLVQTLYDNDSLNQKIIPVTLRKEDWSFIPVIFKPFTCYAVFENAGFDKLYRRMTNQPEVEKPKVGRIKKFTPEIEKPLRVQNALNNEQQNEFTSNMKQGYKILQAYMSLPLTKRFEIAKKLNLLENEETYSSPNSDKISAMVLVRAKNKNQMAELWSMLFNETLDPNPFKA